MLKPVASQRTRQSQSPVLRIEERMESEHSLRILKLRKQYNKRSVYECDSRELRQWLKPVKDMEVAVIPIVGPSRMGKSFMLNYMSRYLADPKNNDWMGRRNNPLEGFLWKAETDPQTDGIWISKPYVIERANGTNIAVILCDTQGVFDQNSNERDWSTIIGLSLLISSCIIFNIFTNLQEDAFIHLESFLDYGLSAVSSLNMKSEKPFQKLLFLVRDWAVPQKYKFGLGGGKSYLDGKLTVSDEQSDSAQNARQLLKDCFQELECFLLPKIGGKSDDPNFNGSVGQLGPDFKRKLNEFIVTLLNPDEIHSKRVNDKNITGDEFCELFQSYVSVFNSTQMDKPSNDELLSASSHIADKIHMRRIKISHLEELKQMVESKPFLTRKDLFQKCKQFKDDYIRDFEDGMSSDNNEFIDKMEDSFEQNIEIVYEINENRRKEIIEKAVDECCEYFRKLSSSQLSGITDLIAFDHFLKSNERKVIEVFKSKYKGEEESLFFKDYLNLTENISKVKDELKLDYSQHLSEAENTKKALLERSLHLYQTDVQYILDNNEFVTKEQFKQFESQIRAKTIESFEEHFKSSDPNINRYYVLDLEKRLKDIRNDLKDKNETKTKEVIESTEQLLIKSIEEYNKNLNEMNDFIQTTEELSNRNKYLQNKSLEDFRQKCLYKSPEFLAPFLKRFETEINNSLENFEKIISQKVYLFETSFQTAINSYSNELEKVSSHQVLINERDLDRSHRRWKKTAIDLYDKHFINGIPSENLYNKFRIELNNKIDQEYDTFVEDFESNTEIIQKTIENLTKEMLDKFISKLAQVMQNIKSEKELVAKVSDITDKIIRKFNEKLNVPDQNEARKSVQKLEDKMNILFEKCKHELVSRKSQMKRVFESDVTQTLTVYTKKMEQTMKMNDIYYDQDQFERTHQRIKDDLCSDYRRHHDPIFDIEPRDYERSLCDEMDEQFRRYVQQRDKTIGKIEDMLVEQHENYKSQMATKMALFNSGEELTEQHNIIERQVLDSFSQQNESVPQNVLSKHIQSLKLRISQTFDDLKIRFNENQQNFIKSVENKLTELIQFYQDEMSVHFKDYEFYNPDNIQSRDKMVRKSVLEKFERFFNAPSNSKMNKVTFKGQLENKLTEELKAIQYRNNENRMSSVEGLRNECENIVQKYRTKMQSKIDSIFKESEFTEQHQKIVAKLIKDLDQSNFQERSMFEAFRDKLLNELDNSRIKFADVVKQKVIEYLERELNTLKSFYATEMEKLFESKQLISKRILNEKHNEIMKTISSDFKDIFTNEFDLNLDQYNKDIRISFEKEFQNFTQKYDTEFRERTKDFNKLMDEFCAKYHNSMEPIISSVETKPELEAKHYEIKTEMLSVFKVRGTENIAEEDVRPFLNDLDHIFDDNLKSSVMKQWETEVRHRLPMIEYLKLNASKYYQDEMNVKLSKKLFVEDKELKEIHKKISELTIKKYRGEFFMLSEKTYLQTLRGCIKMVFDRISENNNLYRPKATHAIGIDLGTTNSCVSYFMPSAENRFNCVIVPNELGRTTTASVVSFRDEEVVVGDVAKEETYGYPKNTIISAKRLIGRRFNDESVQKSLKLWSYDVFNDGNNNPKIKVIVNENEKNLYPEEISAKVLKKMKEISEKHLGCNVTKAVITVPAYFNDAQKEATKDAAKIAGLEVMRIINEPTAAAIAYRLNWSIDTKPRNVLIYDFGGGTFDVAVLTISEGEVDVKAVGGNNHLGGDDFDTNIIKYCLEDFSRKYNETVESDDEGERALSRLRLEAEKCKIKLAGVERTNIHLTNFYREKDLNVMLTRDKFEEINRTLIEMSMDLVLKTLSEAKLKTTEVDDIVLVGGSTRIQKIQGCLSELFGGRPLNHSVNPDEAVAVGAAIHAAMLNERQAVPLSGLKLSDVTPISLGIEIIGGKFSIMIPKNTKVPTTITKNYFTAYDNQKEVSIKVFEGERKFVNQNNLLGSFILTDIAPSPAGDQAIPVTFTLSDEGILKVSARVGEDGQEKDITIIAQKGRMTAEQLKELIKEGA